MKHKQKNKPKEKAVILEIDEQVYNRFKAKCYEKGLTVKLRLTQLMAMEN